MIYSGRDEDVGVVGHNDETVELEAVFGLMLEECLDEEFGVGCALEVAVALEGEDGDGVVLCFWRMVGMIFKRAYPRAFEGAEKVFEI